MRKEDCIACANRSRQSATARLISTSVVGAGLSTAVSVMSPLAVNAGEQQKTVYSDGSTLERTLLDETTATGLFTSADGKAWNINFKLGDAGLSATFDGYSTGSFEASLDHAVAQQLGNRGVQINGSCTAYAKLGVTFDASAIFCAAIGIAPAAAIYTALGLGFGFYAAFMCK